MGNEMLVSESRKIAHYMLKVNALHEILTLKTQEFELLLPTVYWNLVWGVQIWMQFMNKMLSLGNY